MWRHPPLDRARDGGCRYVCEGIDHLGDAARTIREQDHPDDVVARGRPNDRKLRKGEETAVPARLGRNARPAAAAAVFAPPR
ncbi:MAG: hypothetical protein QM622_09735 [Microbacterium sp.]